jgi:hypothetical protein
MYGSSFLQWSNKCVGDLDVSERTAMIGAWGPKKIQAIKTLSLKGHRLSELPEFVFRFPNLELLLIGNNCFKSLPWSRLMDFKHLRDINLTGNQYDVDIGNLCSLLRQRPDLQISGGGVDVALLRGNHFPDTVRKENLHVVVLKHGPPELEVKCDRITFFRHLIREVGGEDRREERMMTLSKNFDSFEWFLRKLPLEERARKLRYFIDCLGDTVWKTRGDTPRDVVNEMLLQAIAEAENGSGCFDGSWIGHPFLIFCAAVRHANRRLNFSAWMPGLPAFAFLPNNVLRRIGTFVDPDFFYDNHRFKGFLDSLLESLAKIYFNGNDFKNAYYVVFQSELSTNEMDVMMGVCLERMGRKTDRLERLKNEKEAFDIYCRVGSDVGQYHKARCLHLGIGCRPDVKQAFAIFNQLAGKPDFNQFFYERDEVASKELIKRHHTKEAVVALMLGRVKENVVNWEMSAVEKLLSSKPLVLLLSQYIWSTRDDDCWLMTHKLIKRRLLFKE